MAGMKPGNVARQSTLRLCIAMGTIAATLAAPAVQGQIVLPTSGTVPASPVTTSLLIGADLAQLQSWWVSPVNAHQTFWRDEVIRYADMTIPSGMPADITTARQAARVAQTKAFRWAMEGNAADLAPVVDALKQANAMGNQALDHSEILINYLTAYDLIRSAALSAADRSAIESQLAVELADLRSQTSYSNNWDVKTRSTLALGALMLRDQELLDHSLPRISTGLANYTTNDGWYAEAPAHYHAYIIGQLIPFIRAYETASGVNLWDDVMPMAELTLNLRLPNGRIPNLVDGTNVETPLFMYSRGIDDPTFKANILWHTLDATTPDDDWVYVNTDNNDNTMLDFFMFADFDTAPAAPTRSPTFIADGQAKIAVFRNDWSDQSDYLLLSPGVTGPSGGTAHQHHDTGEIILYTHGETIFTAPGINRPDLTNAPSGFNSLPATEHNVILVNGSVGNGTTVTPADVTHSNRLDSTEFGDFKGVSDFSTIAMAYNGATVRRSAAFPNEDYFIMADVMDGSAVNTYTFNLIGRGTRTVLTNTSDLIEVKWEVGGAQAIEHLVATHPMSLATDATWMHDRWNQFEQTQRIQASMSAVDAGYLSIIETGSAGAAPKLAVTDLSTTSFAAARIDNATDGYTDRVLSQLSQATRTFDGWTTDATYLYTRTVGGDLESLMMAGGTIVSDAGGSIVELTRTRPVSLWFGADEVLGTISADSSALPASLRLYGLGDISLASINGVSASFTNMAGYGEIDLPVLGGGELEVLYGLTLIDGDANLDGIVNLVDLSTVASTFGQPGRWQTGDFSGDGSIGLADLSSLAANWQYGVAAQALFGPTAATFAGVPEPATILLLLLVWVGLGRQGRCRR